MHILYDLTLFVSINLFPVYIVPRPPGFISRCPGTFKPGRKRCGTGQNASNRHREGCLSGRWRILANSCRKANWEQDSTFCTWPPAARAPSQVEQICCCGWKLLLPLTEGSWQVGKRETPAVYISLQKENLNHPLDYSGPSLEERSLERTAL